MNPTSIHRLTRLGRHAEALAAIATLGPQQAGSREMLYITAVNQRNLKQFSAALATLARLERCDPRFSRLHEERGHCFEAQNDLPRAIRSFEEAVNLNAALIGSWSVLERLYRLAGEPIRARTATEHVAMLERLPPQIVEAGSLFSDGDMAHAERVLSAYLSTTGRHVEALRLLARIEHERRALLAAERLLDEALSLAPQYRAARADYVRVKLDRQDYGQALEQVATLLRDEPQNADYRALQARAWAGLGEHDPAIESLRQLLAETPSWAHLHLLLGNSLKAVGRATEAIRAYQAAQRARPNFGDAYWSLANLKTYRFPSEELLRMRAEEASPLTQRVDRYHLCFALGKALEDCEDYAESWRYYERGNALKLAETYHDAGATEAFVRGQIRVCTPELFANAGAGVEDPAPVFIVGLPRSGSTLIEQMLASHSRIEGTRELPAIERLVAELQHREVGGDDPGYPGVLAELGREEFRRLGSRYLQEAGAYRRGKPLFIDKMPNNFLHLGLIRLILPSAKIIDVRREPMACCFSNLKQLFASGQEFSYSMQSMARHYRSYLELMRHWDAVLPGRVLRIWYEDVVDDAEAGVRRMLDFCEVDFEPSCVEFHRTMRHISTASSEQVRQPIFRSGLSQWRNYEAWLGPLKDALGDALLRYREGADAVQRQLKGRAGPPKV